jgi:hypothetical protein
MRSSWTRTVISTPLLGHSTVSRVAKRFRLQSRHEDGSTTYLAVTSEGSEVLTIGPDGSSYSGIYRGVCVSCAFPRSLDDVCPEHPDRRRPKALNGVQEPVQKLTVGACRDGPCDGS